jgi:hypothetical protein
VRNWEKNKTAERELAKRASRSRRKKLRNRLPLQTITDPHSASQQGIFLTYDPKPCIQQNLIFQSGPQACLPPYNLCTLDTIPPNTCLDLNAVGNPKLVPNLSSKTHYPFHLQLPPPLSLPHDSLELKP